jgi:hypothetical protein
MVCLPAGGARLDVGPPILMNVDDVLDCVRLVPGRVVAIHLEALDHCPMTRQSLRQHIQHTGVMHTVLIPGDGALLQL